ncbi:hypothetical protein QRX46_02775 [Bifidobacterium sp. H1HS10N]|uniref:hypothetical protein n=1 Tax=Bifidobacterium kimbladii TaxID=1293826 RepID=UPI0028BE707B|nr:hypothetical protein [Bifidobacterium sp. H1HS10N]MDT7512349.1 hypothetical protein [Bifidobacterium sp. H1HS10N]
MEKEKMLFFYLYDRVEAIGDRLKEQSLAALKHNCNLIWGYCIEAFARTDRQGFAACEPSDHRRSGNPSGDAGHGCSVGAERPFGQSGQCR